MGDGAVRALHVGGVTSGQGGVGIRHTVAAVTAVCVAAGVGEGAGVVVHKHQARLDVQLVDDVHTPGGGGGHGAVAAVLPRRVGAAVDIFFCVVRGGHLVPDLVVDRDVACGAVVQRGVGVAAAVRRALRRVLAAPVVQQRLVENTEGAPVVVRVAAAVPGRAGAVCAQPQAPGGQRHRIQRHAAVGAARRRGRVAPGGVRFLHAGRAVPAVSIGALFTASMFRVC
mmetsp:Transcript_34411/g.62830  ORF Transcript_34411/g.62830 Transcript_34411/m.62830 type:complete len:226 (+) Transcript_34411:1416-2093(+)